MSELFRVSTWCSCQIDLPSAGAKTNELITKQAWYVKKKNSRGSIFYLSSIK